MVVVASESHTTTASTTSSRVYPELVDCYVLKFGFSCMCVFVKLVQISFSSPLIFIYSYKICILRYYPFVIKIENQKRIEKEKQSDSSSRVGEHSEHKKLCFLDYIIISFRTRNEKK